MMCDYSTMGSSGILIPGAGAIWRWIQHQEVENRKLATPAFLPVGKSEPIL